MNMFMGMYQYLKGKLRGEKRIKGASSTDRGRIFMKPKFRLDAKITRANGDIEYKRLK